MRTPATSGPRLVRAEATLRRRHVHAAIVVAVLAALTAIGIRSPLIAFLAAGAGAGYSLSGSV